MKKAKKQKDTVWIYRLITVLSLAGFIAVWWIYASLPTSFIATPLEVVQRIIYLCNHEVAKANIFGHIWASLKRILGGYAIACSVGIVLGVAFGWFKPFRRFFYPLFSIVRPIPPIAWIPLIILWFGIGERSKIIIVVLSAIFSVVLNTYAGIVEADELLLKAGKTLGANPRQMLFNVALPDAIPTIIAGMKTAMSSSWLGVVGAEMIAARQGLGYLVINGMELLDIQQVMASIVVIAAFSATMTFILNNVERILCPWLHLNAK